MYEESEIKLKGSINAMHAYRDYSSLTSSLNSFTLFYYFFCKVLTPVMWTTSSVGTSDVYTPGSSVTVRRTVMMDPTRRTVPLWSVRTVNGPVRRGDSVYLRGTIVTGLQTVRMKLTSWTVVSINYHLVEIKKSQL